MLLLVKTYVHYFHCLMLTLQLQDLEKPHNEVVRYWLRKFNGNCTPLTSYVFHIGTMALQAKTQKVTIHEISSKMQRHWRSIQYTVYVKLNNKFLYIWTLRHIFNRSVLNPVQIRTESRSRKAHMERKCLFSLSLNCKLNFVVSNFHNFCENRPNIFIVAKITSLFQFLRKWSRK